MVEEETGLDTVVIPKMTPVQAKTAIKAFGDMEKALLDADDFQEFIVKGKKSRFPKKSAFRKLALAFNVSDEIVEERHEWSESVSIWHFTVKAIAPNGRYATGVGSFSTDERDVAHTIHDPRAMAHSRAKNRAISDLIAGGILSAEEMIGVPEYNTSSPVYKESFPKERETLNEEAEGRIKKLRQSAVLEWNKTGKSTEERKAWLLENYGVDSLTKMGEDQLNNVLSGIRAMLAEKPTVVSPVEELGFINIAEQNKVRGDLFQALKKTLDDNEMPDWMKSHGVDDSKTASKEKLLDLINDANSLAGFIDLPESF